MDDYLTKPLDRGRLADAIDRLLISAVPESDDRPAQDRPRAEEPTSSVDAPVDWDALMILMDGDQEFAQHLAQLFIDSGDAALRDIKAALDRGDLGGDRAGRACIQGFERQYLCAIRQHGSRAPRRSRPRRSRGSNTGTGTAIAPGGGPGHGLLAGAPSLKSTRAP